MPLLRASLDGAMPLTRYGVYRPKFDEWWCGGNRWARTDAAALWFDSDALAERAAILELPDPRPDWVVKPIATSRIDRPNGRRTV